jgi:hypothetical protein
MPAASKSSADLLGNLLGIFAAGASGTSPPQLLEARIAVTPPNRVSTRYLQSQSQPHDWHE